MYSQDRGDAAGISMLTNVEFLQASLLQMQHQFADIYVAFIIVYYRFLSRRGSFNRHLSVRRDQVIFREQLWLENQHLPSTVTFIGTMIVFFFKTKVTAGNSGSRQAKRGAAILL